MAERPTRATAIASVEFSTAELAKAESALRDVKNGMPRAIVGATNKTLAKARTVFLRGMTNYLTIRRRNLDRRVYVRKASLSGPPGFIKVMGRPISLANFAVVDTRKRGGKGGAKGTGVRGEIIRGVPIDPNDDFIAVGKFNNRQAFYRRGKGRLPIDADYSPSLFKLFTRSPVKKQLEDFVASDLPAQLDSQIDRFLRIKR